MLLNPIIPYGEALFAPFNTSNQPHTPQKTVDPGLGALKEWFAGKGSADNASDIKQFLLSLMPVLNDCQHWHTDACAVTATRSGLPIIDFVFEDRVAVAVGGNGKGAKGADEWGRVAALLLSQRDWDSSVPREKLRAAAEDVL